MVWCWQENPDNRPTGNEIIEKCNTLHFPKLLDGIRVCDAGQVSDGCTSFDFVYLISLSLFLPPSLSLSPIIGDSYMCSGDH